ncbi:MAG: ATP-binding cassette domain-containing protein [Bacillota bacterium]
MGDAAISLDGISKRYGRRDALKGLTLKVPRGSFFALLGPNGAGKTTTLRLLMGLIRADAGTGEVLGIPLRQGFPPVGLKERIGYVPELSTLYERSTVAELLSFCRRTNRRWDPQTVRRYLDLFHLPLRTTVRHMSLGMRTQLALTLAMGGNPELLILDEPTRGLDPLHRHQFLQALLADGMETGRTTLLSSHDLHQIERLADHVAILNEGRLVVSRPLDELKEQEKRIRVSGTPKESDLAAVAGVRRVSREGAGFLLHASGDPGWLEDAVREVSGVTGVQAVDQSLEEIFLSYVEGTAGA